MSLRQSGTEKVTEFVNAVKGLITAHNSSSSAHSTEMAKKVNVAQGSGNSGKFLKVNSSGNVACESVTIPDVTGKADKSNGASQITDPNSSNYLNINKSRGTPIYDDPTLGTNQQTLNERINLQLGYKSETTHNHSGVYATVSHTHSRSDITNFNHTHGYNDGCVEVIDISANQHLILNYYTGMGIYQKWQGSISVTNSNTWESVININDYPQEMPFENYGLFVLGTSWSNNVSFQQNGRVYFKAEEEYISVLSAQTGDVYHNPIALPFHFKYVEI